MTINQLHTTTWKWVHDLSEILMVFVATYLTMVVMVECTVRVVLLKAGIGLESTIATMSSNANQQSVMQRRKAALNRCIDRSLVKGNLETIHNNNADCCRHSSCCPICLETFLPGDSIMSGSKGCCKSNVFHEGCIKQWLAINDSCPNCRQPMLLEEEEEEEIDPTIAKVENEMTGQDFWGQVKNRVDTATRLRNEILSYFLESERSASNPYTGM